MVKAIQRAWYVLTHAHAHAHALFPGDEKGVNTLYFTRDRWFLCLIPAKIIAV